MNKHYQAFLTRASKLHNNRYDYSKVVYINNHTKVEIICPVHGSFMQTPACHSYGKGQGCRKCSTDRFRITSSKFIERSNKTHVSRYDYSLIVDSSDFNITRKHPIICPVHGLFYQQGSEHIKGHGCPKCKRVAFSRKALAWLDYVMQQDNVHIQHAGNGGEFRIPDTGMSADGYCSDTKSDVQAS